MKKKNKITRKLITLENCKMRQHFSQEISIEEKTTIFSPTRNQTTVQYSTEEI